MSIDRRMVLTAMAGACVTAAAMGAAAGGAAAAVPRATPPMPEPETADAGQETADGEARRHNAQYIVIRRRPRRRWFWGRPWRRRSW